jgi:putative transposase
LIGGGSRWTGPWARPRWAGKKSGANPTDRAKRGVKRSLLTEGAGVPLAVIIEGANRHDCKLVEATLEQLPVERPQPTPKRPQGLCLDKGYDYEEVRALVKGFGYTAHIRARGEEAQAIKRTARFKARRWVVERTHSWLNRFRRILIRWEKKPDNYLALLHLSCALITFRCAWT